MGAQTMLNVTPQDEDEAGEAGREKKPERQILESFVNFDRERGKESFLERHARAGEGMASSGEEKPAAGAVVDGRLVRELKETRIVI